MMRLGDKRITAFYNGKRLMTPPFGANSTFLRKRLTLEDGVLYNLTDGMAVGVEYRVTVKTLTSHDFSVWYYVSDTISSYTEIVFTCKKGEDGLFTVIEGSGVNVLGETVDITKQYAGSYNNLGVFQIDYSTDGQVYIKIEQL
jgi:hypothetical protein